MQEEINPEMPESRQQKEGLGLHGERANA